MGRGGWVVVSVSQAVSQERKERKGKWRQEIKSGKEKRKGRKEDNY